MVSKKSYKKRKARKAVSKKPRRSRRPSKRRKIVTLLIKMLVIFFLLGVLFFFMVFGGIFGPVPSTRQLHVINNPLASEVYSADGKILGRYYIENRSYAAFEDISPNVINALIATEDARFYSHSGIDEIALLRVLFKSLLLQKNSSGGGSTISQQIAKNLFPRKDYGVMSMPVNKLRESIIAYRLEHIYSKEEILALYLNTVPFAENVYGIEVATERFFSKTPKNLSIDEAAVLIGMLKANNYFNPRKHPKRSKGRRDVVIDQMAKYEYITKEEAETYKAKPLKINYRVISYNEGPAPYFLEKLRPTLIEWCKNHTKADGKKYDLYTDGLKIKTTIDYNLQYYAEKAVTEYMQNLQAVFDKHWRNRDIFKGNEGVIESALLQLPSEQRNDEYLNEKAEIKLFAWHGITDTTLTRIDSLKHYIKMLNAGLVAVAPQSGDLKAYIGGIDFRFFKFDHATAQRQTGSVFKPIVYLSALESGISPDMYFANDLKVYDEFNGWSPRNSHDEYGGYYTMKGALAKSLNTISVEVLLDGGIPETVRLAKKLGITSELPKVPSLALGVASVSLEEMVEAYAGIVNNGLPVELHYLVEISDQNNQLLETFSYEKPEKYVASPENCKAIIHMMEAVINNGTGRAIRYNYGIKSDFAGKTGTTQNNSDGWFIGATPDLVVGCWVGADDPRIHFRTTALGQGAYMALPIVGKFYSKMYADPRFSKLKNNRFATPKPEMLALLNIPEYKDVMEIEKPEFNLAEIFRKNKDKKEKTKLEKTTPKTVPDADSKKQPVWEKIKSIFKKKNK